MGKRQCEDACGASFQAANPTPVSACLGTPELDAGYNQVVSALGDGCSASDKVAVSPRRGRHAVHGAKCVDSWARGRRFTAANARGPYVAHSP
eukprot:6518783-Prymnesium_polylepis.1